MGITIGTSSQIAERLCDGYDIILRHKATIFSSLEATFYDRVTLVPKAVDDLIARLSIRQFHMIQLAFTSINGVLAFISVKEITDLSKDTALSFLSTTFLGDYLPAAALTAVIFTSCFTIVSKNMDQSNKSHTQVIAATIQVATIISSLALAILTENKASMMLRAGFSAYSLWRNDEVTWTTGNAAPDLDDGGKVLTRKGFEKVYGIYNTFHAALSLLQEVPELAPSITVFKHVLFIPDLVMGGVAHYYLTKSLKNQGSTISSHVLQTSLAAIATFFGFKALFEKKGNLDCSGLEKVSASWSLPISEQIRGFVESYRIVTTAGLAYFSPNKKFNLLSLFTQIVSLKQTVSRPWLLVSQEYKWADLYTYALLPSANQHSLNDTVTKIVELQQTILDKGERQIYAHYTDGRLTHYTMKLIYRLPSISDIREYAWKPYIWSIGGTAYHSQYGSMTIFIWT